MHLYLTYVLYFTLAVASFAFGIDRVLDRMNKRDRSKDDQTENPVKR